MIVRGDPEWFAEAACKGKTDLFFPKSGTHADSKAAIQVCYSCPVRKQCLQYAVDHRIYY